MDAEAPTGVYSTGRFPSPSPMFPGCPALFIQTQGSRIALIDAASLVREEGMGVVFTISTTTKHRIRRLRDLARLHRAVAGPVDHVLFDANRYAGKNRRSGSSPLDRDWIRAQHDAGTRVALTDSPYIGKSDQAALRATLEQAATFGDRVVAVLPLHLDWLTKDTPTLVDIINDTGIPVALALEHKADPLGVQAAVAGLTRLLTSSTVSVGLLRSDLSVIGAIAFGAAFGAVGTSTGLRHIYPQSKPDNEEKKFFTNPKVGVFVPWSMGYRSIMKIGQIISADYEHLERYRCQCRFCYNRTLDWIGTNADAYRHSLASVAIVGEDILGPSTLLGRQHAWVSACGRAQRLNLEIAADSVIPWESPKYLAGWHRLRPTLQPLPIATPRV